MVPAALKSLNHTNDKNSISNQYPQPTTHQHKTKSYPVFSSLTRMNGKSEIAGQLCILSKNLPTGRTSEENSCHGWSVA